MTDYLPEISVTAPVGWALGRVKRMLFKPFDIHKWLVIGFCAWLANLGEAGGNLNVRGPSGGGHSSGGTQSFREFADQAGQWISQNLYWIVPVAVAVVVLMLALGLLVMWLSSRGKFMFLHCVALDVAEGKRPWREFATEANSLFWFRLVLGLIGLAVFLPLGGGFTILVGQMLYYEKAEGGYIVLAIGLVLALFVLGICFALVYKFTKDFVVPIMFLRRVRCTVAWREFLDLLRGNAGRFTLYILFQIVLAIVIGFMIMAVVLATCCTAACLLAIPYVGTVILLPVLVFERSYSLHYLAQYGPAYDVFPSAPQV